MTTRTIELRVLIPVTGLSGDITVHALRADLVDILREHGDRLIEYRKGTLPDPDTLRTISADYGRAVVKSGRGR